MAVSPRDRLIITIVVAVIIVIALISFLVYPQIQKLNSLTSEVAAATAQADAARLQLQERQGFKDRAVETSAKWLRLQNQVPESPDLPSLIIELQDTAFKSGVQVVTVTPSTPSVTDVSTSINKIPVSVEIYGNWSDTVDYVEALMRLDRGLRLMNTASHVVADSAVIDQRNTALHAYSIDTVIGFEAYTIPSAPATATPAATP